MAATESPRFEGKPILTIDEAGSLTVKFQQLGVPGQVSYELTGRLTITYVNTNKAVSHNKSSSVAKVQIPDSKTLSYSINSRLSTSSSTENVVNATIVSKVPPTKPGNPTTLGSLSYDGLLLKDQTNNIELRLDSIEKNFQATSLPLTSTGALANTGLGAGLGAGSALLSTPAPSAAPTFAPVSVHPVPSIPPALITFTPTPSPNPVVRQPVQNVSALVQGTRGTRTIFDRRAEHTMVRRAGASGFTPQTLFNRMANVAVLPPAPVVTPVLSPASVPTPTLVTASATSTGSAPTIKEGVLTISISAEEWVGVKQIVLNLE